MKTVVVTSYHKTFSFSQLPACLPNDHLDDKRGVTSETLAHHVYSHHGAKICSAHFTEDSFVRSKKTRLPIRRRNLLPSAVPTLLLSETENSDNESNMDFKVIFKDFPLSVIHENVQAESFELLVSPDDPSNVQECTIDVESPKGRFRSNLEEKRLEETYAMRRTPPTSVSCDYVHGATFPTRSENEYCRRNVRHVGKMKKRQNTSKRKINFTSEEIVEILSEENTPPWKRKQRFMLENCTTICDNTISMTQDSEPSVTIEWLNSELQHSKSVCEYYKQSKSTDLENLKTKQEEYESLKLVLQQKNEEIQNLRKEMEEHRNAYKDLQEKLTAANIVENICDKAVKEKVKEALKPYFTEGQIRCILEQDRKWIHWSIDDYASAISLRSISPKTYKIINNNV